MDEARGPGAGRRLSARNLHIDPAEVGAPTSEEATDPVVLDEEEASLLAEEAKAASAFLTDTESIKRLLAACKEGVLPPDLQHLAGQITLASLKGGRARKLYLAEGERVLTGLLRKTPQGRSLEHQVLSLNRALSALRGRRVDAVRLAMRTAGHFTLTIEAEGVALTLFLTPEGVSLESVGV
jgi:hypothetical protein